MQEIERKFLVTSEAFKNEAFKRTRITQGFLNTNPLRTVRVRIQGENGFITVKGKPNETGVTRFEWERQIPLDEGLIVAEIELKTENEAFSKPQWLGMEVTGEIKYYNSNLSKTPFKDW